MAMNTSSRAEAERADRRATVAGLLRAGETYRAISDTLSISLGTVVNDVRAIRKARMERATEQYEVVIADEIDKLDAVEHGLMASAQLGSAPHVSAWVRVAQRRARLLGLDKPVKIEHGFAPEAVGEIISTVIDRVLRELGVEPTSDVDVVVARHLTLVANEQDEPAEGVA